MRFSQIGVVMKKKQKVFLWVVATVLSFAPFL